MPCLLGFLAYFFPRVVILLLFVFTRYLEGVFQTVVWPVLGFIFMPLTTLAYAFAIKSNGSVSGFYAFLVILAALLDLGTHGIGPLNRRKRRRE